MRQDCDILSHQFCGQQGGGNLHTRRTMVREKSRLVKIKNIKEKIFYMETQK